MVYIMVLFVTISIMTLGKTTVNTIGPFVALSIMTLSRTTLSITTIQHNGPNCATTLGIMTLSRTTISKTTT